MQQRPPNPSSSVSGAEQPWELKSEAPWQQAPPPPPCPPRPPPPPPCPPGWLAFGFRAISRLGRSSVCSTSTGPGMREITSDMPASIIDAKPSPAPKPSVLQPRSCGCRVSERPMKTLCSGSSRCSSSGPKPRRCERAGSPAESAAARAAPAAAEGAVGAAQEEAAATDVKGRRVHALPRVPANNATAVLDSRRRRALPLHQVSLGSNDRVERWRGRLRRQQSLRWLRRRYLEWNVQGLRSLRRRRRPRMLTRRF